MEALREIIKELIAALISLVDAAHDPDALEALLKDLGWTPTSAVNLPPELSQAGSALLRVYSADEELSIIELVNAIKRLVDAINVIRNIPDGAFPAGIDVPAFKLNIARELLDYSLVEHLLQNHHKLGGVLKLTGFIRETEMPASGLRTARLKREVMWSRIGSLLTDPLQGFREVFAWDSPTPKLTEVIGEIASLLDSYNLQLSYFEPEGDLLTFINVGAITPVDNPIGFDVAFDTLMGAPAGVSAGVKIMLMPPTASRGAAIAFFPYAQLNGAKEIPLSDTIVLSIRGNADFTKGVSIVLSPGLAPEAKTGFLGGSVSNPAEAQIGIKVIPPADEPERRLIGTPDATRVTIKTAGFSFGVQVAASNKLDVFAVVELENARVVIKPAQGEADSFLASFLGPDGLSAQLSLGLRLSSLNGFHLTGSGGLETSFPIHVTLGPIDFQALSVGLKPGAQGVDIEAGATLAGKLGPLTAIVDGAGFKIKAQFPDPPTGNLGPVDLGFGFKPPKGVGLSISAGAIQGGGFLFFDFDKQEYAGVLQLSLAQIVTVTAIGLVTTRMPDGSQGFSLLLIITAEFGTGIQLGFGFTLLGVGGLLGLNRTMRLEVLAEGVRNGALSNIMFPRDVIANAPRIISDLRNFFPPEQGKFLIGPMVKLGWGTPTLVSISLGIIIEIPGNIAIIGILRVALPADEAALIVLQVSFIGALEFDKQRVWFFATLYESRVLFIPLEGDMGLLMAFGADANFVLSVGGFHPRFNPPPLPFPSPRRVSFSIISTPTARIRVEGYFGVTSNTVQFGAHAELVFGLDDFGIEGHIGFDVLIQFSPFYMIAEISASVSLNAFGVGVFSIRLRFTLEGMSPWRARGAGSISLLFFEISADFDITWGETRVTSLPPIAVIPLLKAEFDKIENWRAELPKSSNLLVSLRKMEGVTDALVLHPVGILRVSQKAVPLDQNIDKVGSQKPNDAKRFTIEVPDGGLGKAGDTLEQFALAQFKNMDDATKLSVRAFEPLYGGVDLSVSGQQLKSSKVVKRVVRYEQVIIDTNYRRYVKRFSEYVFSLFNHFLAGSAVSKSTLSTHYNSQLQPFEEKVKVGNEAYTVAFQSNNQAFAQEATFSSQAAAYDYMQQVIAENPNRAEELHVVPQFEVMS
jgi:hypothetical protein